MLRTNTGLCSEQILVNVLSKYQLVGWCTIAFHCRDHVLSWAGKICLKFAMAVFFINQFFINQYQSAMAVFFINQQNMFEICNGCVFYQSVFFINHSTCLFINHRSKSCLNSAIFKPMHSKLTGKYQNGLNICLAFQSNLVAFDYIFEKGGHKF